MGAELRGEESAPAGGGVLGGVLAEYAVHPEGPDHVVDGGVGHALVAGGVEDGAGAEGRGFRFQPAEDHGGALVPQLGEGIAPAGVTGTAMDLEGTVQGGAAGCRLRSEGTAKGADGRAGEVYAAGGEGVQQAEPGPGPGAGGGRAGGEALQAVKLGQRAAEVDRLDGLLGGTSAGAAPRPAASEDDEALEGSV